MSDTATLINQYIAAGPLSGSTDAPPYQYVEIVDVRDMEAFGQDIATETMRRVAAEFGTFADATFILTEQLG